MADEETNDDALEEEAEESEAEELDESDEQDDADAEDEADDDGDDEADDDGDEADDDDESDDDDDEADDDDEGRAAEVAKALGLDDDDDESDEDEDDEAKKAPANRAERRRQRAQRRRRRRAKKDGDDDDAEDAPKDRNKRRREALLARRRRAAEAEDEDEAQPDGLLPSEMVDDALARGGDATIKWVRKNWPWLQWALAGTLFAGIGLLAWKYFTDEATGEASESLATAIVAEEATVILPDEDNRTDEEKKLDIRTVYASRDEQQKAALDAYKKIAGTGDGAAILAKLGEAGLMLDRGEWDGAIGGFDAVLGTPLATADKDVKGRALEGKAFALEGKGDMDGALAAFTQMADLGEDYFKTISLYHQGRIHFAKGEKDKATELLKEAKKISEKAKVDARMVTNVHPYRWLDKAIEGKLREIDPKLVAPSAGGKSPQLTNEQLQQMLKQKGLSAPPGMPGAPPAP